MESIIIYLLKASVGVMIFYLTYRLLLGSDKDFVFNRVYLSGSVAASFIIPMITFRTTVYVDSPAESGLVEVITGISPALPVTEGVPVLDLVYPGLLILYLGGATVHALKFAYSVYLVMRLKRNSTPATISGRRIFVTDENIRAFTFLDNIVVGKSIIGHPSLGMILEHESVHAREKHYFDIMTAGVLNILQWFNPFARLHGKAIIDNLEYRADDVVTRKSDPVRYQLTMVSLADRLYRLPVFSGLNSTNLKKRIIMMKSKGNRYAGIARIAVIPVFVILLLTLCREETVMVDAGENLPSETVAGAPGEDYSAGQQESLQTIDEMRQFLAQNLRYPYDAARSGITGRVDLYVTVSGEGFVTGVSAQPPATGHMDINEIVIVGYNEAVEPVERYQDPLLFAEVRRVAERFPVLDIPEIRGRVIKLSANYFLQ